MLNLSKRDKRGVALLLTVGTFLIVVILANIVLSSIFNQGRLAKHLLARTQAFYAAQGGVYYAFERLRMNNWTVSYGSPVTYTICDSVANCTAVPYNLPSTISALTVNLTKEGTTGRTKISVKANYTN